MVQKYLQINTWNTDDKTIKITIIDSFFLWYDYYYYCYYIQIVVGQIKIENFINNNFFFIC